MTAPGVLRRAGLWSALVFVLHLTWEIAHVPLLQWLIVPPAMVGVYRTLEPVLFGQHGSQSPISIHDLARSRT